MISNSFIIIRDFISEQLNQDPKELLGNDAWSTLVSINEVYEKERNDCNESIESLYFFSETIKDALDKFIFNSCNKCGSDLIASNQKNIDAVEATFICKACDAIYTYEEIITPAINDYYENEKYVAMTDGGDSPVVECPFCYEEAYLYEEQRCSACGETAIHECVECYQDIPPAELSEDGLCGYCSHTLSKDD